MATYEEAMKESLEYFNGDELAATAFVGKYALKDNEGNFIETNPDQMHRRIAKELARVEAKYPNALSEDEIYEYLRGFRKLIPQGSPMFGIGNKYQTVSLSNCYVLESPMDSYASIMHTDQELAHIYRRRGGCGVDISNIRPKGMVVKNAAKTTTGIGTFMERYSNTTREVGQESRRGACLISISVHHPEVETFINIKRDRTKVTGANVSIRFSDEFMQAVKDDTEYEQRWPVDSKTPSISKKVKARKIWDQFIDSSWESAEPGALFWDTAQKYTPADCYKEDGFESISTNPCGEIVLSKNDSCRLFAMNLAGFVTLPFTSNAKFNFDNFAKSSYDAQKLMDDLIDLELECIDKIIAKIDADPEPDYVKTIEKNLWLKIKETCKKGRRTGLGITALGDTLAMLGIRYGSQESIEFTTQMYKTLAVNSYRASVHMARDRGPFLIFSHEKEKDHPFLSRIWSEDEVLYNEYLQHGRRNIANNTIAPTGTLSLLACLHENIFGTTSGIEPAFLLSYTRRKKINANDANTRIDFVDQSGDSWQEFKVYHPGFKLWKDVAGLTDEDIKLSPYYKATSGDVDWISSVDVQAAAQTYTDHSISRTLNLPSDATRELVGETFMSAWEKKLKGFTIYRDGSRSGVLVSSNTSNKTDNIIEHHAPKRPVELNCDVNLTTVQGEKWTIFVGLLNGKPYEIMGGLSKYVSIPKRVKTGKIVKHNGEDNPKARYDFHYDYEQSLDNEAIIKDIGNIFENPINGAFTRTLSLSLRHGAPVQYIVEQLQKGSEQDSDLFSFSKVIARVLKKYIVDGTKTTQKKCPECGSASLVYREGCVACLNCTHSKC